MSEINASFRLNRQPFNLDVSFTLPGRGVTALFGSSGSGKTSLLRCLAGLEKAHSGYLKMGDQVWHDQDNWLPPHQRQVGYVFQENRLFNHLTVAKNLQFGLQRIPATQQRIQFAEAAELLGLENLLHRFPQELSGGQQQRVAIARALLTSPELMLMDEPLASLDLASKAEILPYLETLNRSLQIPIIYVSHAPDEVLRIAEYMLLLENGRLLAAGPVNELLTRSDLPLAHLDEACAIIAGQVSEHDDEYHLTQVAVSVGTATVSRQQLSIGHAVRVRIKAKDVSLALEQPRHSSISNIWPVIITDMCPTNDPARLLITLEMNGERLLSQITARSAHLLQLEKGKKVYAQVKSVALMN